MTRQTGVSTSFRNRISEAVTYMVSLLFSRPERTSNFRSMDLISYSLNTLRFFMAWDRNLFCYIVTYVDSHLHIYTYICRIIHSDTTIKTHEGKRRNEDTGRKTQEGLFTYILYLERVVQGLHVRGCWGLNINFIFWPHCYDRHVVSLLFSWCWGLLHRGFPRAPSVWCGLPYHISSLTLWESAGNCSGPPELNWVK